jgi:hypothetical protein
MKRAFDASPKELAEAALIYARKNGKTKLAQEAFDGLVEHLATKYCNGCCYGSHCLGSDPDCACGCK